jgi:hypothetical protein
MRADSTENFRDVLRLLTELQSEWARWDLLINELSATGTAVSVLDETTVPVFELHLTDLSCAVTSLHLRSADTARFAVSCGLRDGGGVRADGRYVPALGSLESSVKVDSIHIRRFQPYLFDPTRMVLTSGSLSASGVLSLSQAGHITPRISYAGDMRVDALQLKSYLNEVNFLGRDSHEDADRREQIVPVLAMVGTFAAGKVDLHLDIARNDSAYAFDRSTPVASSVETVSDTARAPRIVVEQAELVAAEVSLAGVRLPLLLSPQNQPLTAALTIIVAGDSSRALVSPRSLGVENGPSSVDGALESSSSVSSFELNALFTDVEMTGLSPYSGESAGLRIARVRVSPHLKLNARSGQLNGNAGLLLEKLTVVEGQTTDEQTGFPVKLAVALLKDGEGNINLTPKISGSLYDPRFNMSALVWQSVSKMTLAVVDAPFHFLGTLVGASDEETETIQFEPGHADVTREQSEKLSSLARALTTRPSLALAIHGATDEVVDRRAIQERKFLTALQKRMMGSAGRTVDSLRVDGSDAHRKRALEELFREEFVNGELESIEATYARAATDSNARSFDLRAYMTALQVALVRRQLASEEELLRLADLRAQAIRSHLLDSGRLPDVRVTIGGREILSNRNEAFVSSRLSLYAVGEPPGSAGAQE